MILIYRNYLKEWFIYYRLYWTILDSMNHEKDAEQRKKTEKLHTKIASLHGAKAFRKYLEENSRKKPEFMNTIAKLQDQNDQRYNL